MCALLLQSSCLLARLDSMQNAVYLSSIALEGPCVAHTKFGLIMSTAAKSAPAERPLASGQWSCTTLGAADAVLHTDTQDTLEAWLQHVAIAVS